MTPDHIHKEIDLSKLDCFYADLRIEEEAGTQLIFKNGELENFQPIVSIGAFLRVYNNGKWFYKSLTDLSKIKIGYEELIEHSRVFNGESKDIFKAVPKDHREILKFTDRDPRRISLAEKRALCESYLGLTGNFKEVKQFRVVYKDRYQKRWFKSSRSSSFIYDYADYGLVLGFVLRDNEHLFTDRYRKFGTSFDELKGLKQEAIEFLKESLNHLRAPTIQPGKYQVVLDSEIVGVFTHESFGHKSEADGMMGDEAARKEWTIGTRVASETVSIVDGGSAEDNSGYCPFDDEGMPAQKTYLIKNGLLQGRLHSLTTAAEFDEAPTSNARAINFEFEPIVRMTNTYIEAGSLDPDQLIGTVKDGLYMADVNHGSGLSTFTIAPARSYRIRNGKIAEPVKVAVISGTVFDTLNKISGVSKNLSIKSSAFGGCGKNEQWPLRVADGGPMIKIDEIQVG